MSLFSALVQSTFSVFLSSILPPPWLMAKAGAEARNKAVVSAVIADFMVSPLMGCEDMRLNLLECINKTTRAREYGKMRARPSSGFGVNEWHPC